MSFFGLLLLSLSLASDAFSIAVCNGIAYGGDRRQAVIIALAFGLAQAVMPLIGYAVGSGISGYIQAYTHWLACGLLAFIGGKMLRDGLRDLRALETRCAAPLTPGLLFCQAMATSIDALAVGVGLGALETGLITASATIGITTFLCCIFGATIGARFGRRLKRYALPAGGIVLILIGLRILFSGLGAS